MSLKEKLTEADNLQQQIDKNGKLPADVLKKINYKFRLDWNYYSNSMEGNTLTKEETRSVMVGNLTVGGKPFKDILEMKGHDEVVTEILKIGKQEVRLSEARVREIHKAIMHEEDESKKEKIGAWKTVPNYLYNYKGERIDFALPAEVPELMHGLLNRTNAAIDAIVHHKKNAQHPIEVALQFHLDYVFIHPFYDGNGRTARILTNLILISFGYPPFWIKTDERDRYGQYIGDIQVYGGNPDLFFEFGTDLIIRSQRIMLKAIEGRDIEEGDDLDKRIKLIDNMLEEIDGEIKIMKGSPNALSNILDNLIDPLFRLIFNKVLKINHYFTDIEFAYYINGGGSTQNNINDLMEGFVIGWENLEPNINKVTLNIKFSKLKKMGLKATDFYKNINLNFQEHKYQIIGDNNVIGEYLYHQTLNNEQIEVIAKTFVNEVLDHIENEAGRIKKD